MKNFFYFVFGFLIFASTMTIAQDGPRKAPSSSECQRQLDSSSGCGGGRRVCCANTRLNHT